MWVAQRMAKATSTRRGAIDQVAALVASHVLGGSQRKIGQIGEASGVRQRSAGETG